MPTAVSVHPNPFDRFIEIELTCAENRDCIILLANLKDNRIIRMLGAGLEKGHRHLERRRQDCFDLTIFEFTKNAE